MIEGDARQASHAHAPRLGERLKSRFGGWMLERLRKRAGRELRDYYEPPDIRPGPFFRRHRRGETHVYRSLIQIHFHPRERERR